MNGGILAVGPAVAQAVPANGRTVVVEPQPGAAAAEAKPVIAPPATAAGRPPALGDATPRQRELDKPGQAAARSDARSTLSPQILASLRQQFGAQFERLPPAELAAFARSYNDFTSGGTEKRDAAPFLQAFGRALVADRRRMVGEMTSNPTEGLVRLAPALERQAGLMRVVEAADFVARHGDAGFEFMRNRVSTDPLTVEASRRFTRETINTPEGWRAFRELHGLAAGPYALHRDAASNNPHDPAYIMARFAASMEVLHQPGADGASLLQRGSAQDIATAATRNLIELGRDNPQLQAFSASQVRDMADGVRLPGTKQRFSLVAGEPPRLNQELTVSAGGLSVDLMAPSSVSAAFASYRDQVRAVVRSTTVPVDNSRYYSGILTRPTPRSFTSALAVFENGTLSTTRGLDVAAERLATNKMGTTDLLPLARQVQGHLALQAVGADGSEPNPALVPAIMDLGAEIRRGEKSAAATKHLRMGTAALGVVTGIGLLASGPLGWGVGLTATLAAGSGAAAITTIALDSQEFATRLRAGGLDQAGLVISELERESKLGFGASVALNSLSAVAGMPSVAAARRLVYARDLTAAMRTEGDVARTTAITDFLQTNNVMTREAFAALAPERQGTALRLIERFGSEVSPEAMAAILRYGAVNAEITNASGAVANVDHMHAAYSEMNRAEAATRGRALTERERVLNAVATVGTDAQGKFGHANLPIMPIRVGERVLTTPSEFLREVRQRAVDQAFEGIEQAQGVDRVALRAFRERFLRDVVNGEPAARGPALGQIMQDVGGASPETAAWVRRHLVDTELIARLSPFTEGAYIHNVVDPGRIFEMGRVAGLTDVQSAEAAYRATMHGFGNAFVAGAYPGLPEFASVMRPGTTTRLFSDAQLANLNRVGATSLAWNQDLAVPRHLLERWRLSSDAPPRGARQIFSAALRANGGQLPEGMQEWLRGAGAAAVEARRRAELGAGATNADNLGNFVPEGMRKWSGIFARTPATPATDGAVGDQLVRLMSGLNGYAIEEYALGNLPRFAQNFSGPAARVGLYLPERSATYRWIMRKEGNRFVVDAADTSAAAVEARRAAAAAIRQRNPSLVGSDVDVLGAFYNQPQADAAALALAELSEGTLPPAFSSATALRSARNFDLRLQGITQMVLYQQGASQGVRFYDNQ